MLRNILFQLLALISNIVTQPWRQARFHTVWFVFATPSGPARDRLDCLRPVVSQPVSQSMSPIRRGDTRFATPDETAKAGSFRTRQVGCHPDFYVHVR